VAAGRTNPFVADGPIDVVCLELSRTKTEENISMVIKKDFLFNRDFNNIEFDFVILKEFREFLLSTHCAVIKTEGDVNVLYPLFEEMLISKFSMLMLSAREPRPRAKLDKVTALAVGYIENNLKEKIGVAHIARATGVSPRTLEKKFKQDFGMSPIAFLIDRRLEKVHSEINDPKCIGYISQVATKWGFSHMADFGQRFKQKYGKAPSQVRDEAAS
jgi:AraC-like DNA-binding protein